MMKQHFARVGLRWSIGRFRRDPEPFHRLLGEAIALQLGHIGEDKFRQSLDSFYANLDRPGWMKLADFQSLRQRLDRPGGYKAEIVRFGPMAGRLRARFSIWGRRFGLLRHLGIRADVLILRAGEQIPPHGHHRVVSGFCVLEGRVAARNFDRVSESGDHVLLRKTFDRELGPGGYTTNSEFYHNVHWLLGLAPVSYLARVTVAGVPTSTFGQAQDSTERVYVDPRGPALSGGLIKARYVTEAEARSVPFDPQETGAPPATAAAQTIAAGVERAK